MPKDALPTYRLHKASGQAIVSLNGQTIYLGKHDTPESREAYDRTIAEWLANGRVLPKIQKQKEVTVAEVLLAFREHAETYYRRPDGTPTSEVANYGLALRPVRRLYGSIPASEFTPRALQVVRSEMIRRDLARTTINSQVRRIVSVFKWAVAQELVDPSTHQALKAVSGLRRGRTEARESEPVRPVPEEMVDAVQPFVSRQVWAIIQLQRLTGAREASRPSRRTRRPVWAARPSSCRSHACCSGWPEVFDFRGGLLHAHFRKPLLRIPSEPRTIPAISGRVLSAAGKAAWGRLKFHARGTTTGERIPNARRQGDTGSPSNVCRRGNGQDEGPDTGRARRPTARPL